MVRFVERVFVEIEAHSSPKARRGVKRFGLNTITPDPLRPQPHPIGSTEADLCW